MKLWKRIPRKKKKEFQKQMPGCSFVKRNGRVGIRITTIFVEKS